MGATTLTDAWDLVQRGGVPFIVFAALIASMRGNFQWRRETEAQEKRHAAELEAEREARKADREEFRQRMAEMRADRDEWQTAFLRVTGATEVLASGSRRGASRLSGEGS